MSCTLKESPQATSTSAWARLRWLTGIEDPAKHLIAAVAGIVVLCHSAAAWAYVGPGAGVSLLSAAIGLLAAVAVAVGVIVLYPLRMLRQRRAQAGPATPDEHPQTDPAPDTEMPTE